MRLLDLVAQARGPVAVEHPDMGCVRLPGAADFADEVATVTTRYVLMDDVTRACGTMIIEQPDLLVACIDLVRVPASGLWLEWCNHRLHPDPAVAAKDQPQRAGMLIHADESGRRGSIQSFWEERGVGAVRSPTMMYFDLDGAPDLSQVAGSDVTLAPLLALTRTTLEPAWARYYRGTTSDPVSYAAALRSMYSCSWKDFLIAMSFSLMLSMRGELDFAPSALTRLNEARRKHNKAPLLNFVEVGASLFDAPHGQHAVGSTGGAGSRNGVRVHHVRGHFVRRNQAIFWRRTHLRGDMALGIAPARITRMGLNAAR